MFKSIKSKKFSYSHLANLAAEKEGELLECSRRFQDAGDNVSCLVARLYRIVKVLADVHYMQKRDKDEFEGTITIISKRLSRQSLTRARYGDSTERSSNHAIQLWNDVVHQLLKNHMCYWEHAEEIKAYRPRLVVNYQSESDFKACNPESKVAS
ncbi:MAG: hypothetical protein M1828_002470 [Chrysothrix sp. TS-e1954]|nr:MAG: hypothetical protein M1828_002470 [Chrysothrix sp. TS-e1954]